MNDYYYLWKGERKKIDEKRPFLAQAYLALLDDEHIENRAWMKEENNKKIKEFVDKTGYKAFRFDMQTKSKRDNGYYYCIQMQSNYESQSRSNSGKPKSHSYCDVQIHEKATPSPTVFRDACWSSACKNHEPKSPGEDKPKTMTVEIYENNTWKNKVTGETGYDEKAKNEDNKELVADLETKMANNTVTGEDFRKVYGDKKKN